MICVYIYIYIYISSQVNRQFKRIYEILKIGLLHHLIKIVSLVKCACTSEALLNGKILGKIINCLLMTQCFHILIVKLKFMIKTCYYYRNYTLANQVCKFVCG